MDVDIIDQATAVTALRAVRDNLAVALDNADKSMDELRETIVKVRPAGLLTVDEMAKAVERDRNYVDSVWSKFGTTSKGKQTRATLVIDLEAAKEAMAHLTAAASRQRSTAGEVDVALAERNRVVAMVYASGLLGPTPIANEVNVDRNHVLRIARKAGVPPVHRQGSRNHRSSPGNHDLRSRPRENPGTG
jgi:hypothetical protein